MASHERPTLSILERLDALFIRTPLLVTAILIGTVTTHPFRLKLGWPWKRTLALTFVRALGNILSPRMLRARAATTGQVVATVCAAQHLPHRSEPLTTAAPFPPATLHYIDIAAQPPAKPTRRIVLYLPGGGYSDPLNPGGQLQPFLDLARAARASHLAVLEYTLAPALTYPGHLAQASAALTALLADRHPADIILAGDSAGGNLALALLAHIKARHPDARVPAVELGGGVLAGVLLISPWVAMSTSAASFAEFDGVDMIQPRKLGPYIERFGPPTAPRSVYAEPVVRRDGFWESVPAERVLITAGSHECFVDDVRDMAALMGAVPYDAASGKDVKVGLAIGQNEVHVQMAVDTAVKLGICESQRLALQWIESL